MHAFIPNSEIYQQGGLNMPYTKDVVISAYGRSPCCRALKGAFAHKHPLDYAAQTMNGVLAKVPQIQPHDIDDIIVGCARPVNQMDKNAARLIAMRAGLPFTVTGQTINRFCSSSLQAIATAANAIAAGQEEILVAGGVEDMSHCFTPYPAEYQDHWFEKHCPGGYMAMGETAERVAEQYGITRARMEKMAVESHAKAHQAQQEGKLKSSIIPITVVDEFEKAMVIDSDEGIRPNTNLESMQKLKPCFRENGLVTAATSSQTTDAAAFMILMSAERAKEMGVRPLARILGFAVAGCDPTIMGIGPVYAVPKVMKRIGLTVADMDVIELNEAFAAQALACMDILGLPEEKVNPYGGAMALGHPMGATGAILTGKALDYLGDNAKRYALVTMCIGGGMGAAAVFERLH